MADNVPVTPGSGAIIATDDVGGAQYQRVKLDVGADGATSPVVRGAQNSANSLPVVLATDQATLPVSDAGGSLTVDGTVTANLAAGVNNIGDVDVLTVPAPLNVVGGGTEAAAIRVTLANNSTGLVSVDDNGGSLTVDGTVAVSGTVPVTDNGGSLTVDGTVTAQLAAGTNNIGDVDVLTVPAPLSTTGGGTEATALRVTLANDSTGVVSVDDNGGSLTVDGTVAVSGTVPVTDNGGSLTVDGTVAVTNADLTTIAGAIKAEDAGHNTGDVGVMALAVRNDSGAVLAGTTGDYIPLSTNSSGNLRTLAAGSAAEDAPLAGNPVPTAAKASTVGTPPAAMSNDGDAVIPRANLDGSLVTHHGHVLKSVTGTISATTTIVNAVTGKKIKVYAVSLITQSTTAVTATFKDGAAGTAKFTAPLQAITGTAMGIAHAVAPPGTLFEGAANTLLELALSAGQSVTYNVSYFEEA